MTIVKKTDPPEIVGQKIYGLISELYPICRSITGNGFRETLRLIGKHVPLEIHEVPSGTEVFDWTVPREWNITEAHIKNSRGQIILDFKKSNLHVVSYSIPVRKRISFEDLRSHLHTLPAFPNWIPYRTSYYEENWGFCLSHNQLLEMKDDEYEVLIDSSLENGHLTYGELYLRGELTDEVLISCHSCHPSLCNDNLSGVALATVLASYLSPVALRYSYRFLFIPGTIGSITWLCLNERQVSRIKHGLVLSCIGDSGKSTYKKSRIGEAEIDKAVLHVLRHSGQEYKVTGFSPYGYDERQYCSPAFNLPVGCLSRTPYGHFPEYHTSADNLDFVKPYYLGQSFLTCLSILEVLEKNHTYLNQNPKCEPQLGKRGLYRRIGGSPETGFDELALLWVLSLSDSKNSLLDIADESGLPFDSIRQAATILANHGLLTTVLESPLGLQPQPS